MRYILVALLFFTPVISLAASCSNGGATVVYINGIATTKDQAEDDLYNLVESYQKSTGDYQTQFINAYNPTHGQVNDFLKVVTQMLRWSQTNWNEDTNGDIILNQIHDDLTTQKVLLVGHSQGAFYANETYKYLTAHGLNSAAVYNVATPASYTAGNGGYLNSSNDTVLAEVRALRENPGLGFLAEPLANNAVVPITSDDETGHKFSQTYIEGAASTIVSAISSQLNSLAPTKSSDIADCFVPPDNSLAHKVVVAAGDVGTSVGATTYLASVAAYNGSLAAVASAFDAIDTVALDIKTTIGGIGGLAHSGESKYQGTNYDIINRIYGSSNEKVDGENLQGLLGSAVILSTLEQPQIQPPSPPESTTTTATSSSELSLIPTNTTPGFGGGGGAASAVVNEPQAEPTTVDIIASTTDVISDPQTNTPEESTTTATTTSPTLPSPNDQASWPQAGFFCDGDVTILTPSETAVSYKPTSFSCTYIGTFSPDNHVLRAQIYKGVVGSSTNVSDVNNNNESLKILTDTHTDLTNAQSGEQYFIALSDYDNNFGGSNSVTYFGDLMYYFEFGTRNDGTPSAPPLTYYIIPFVIP